MPKLIVKVADILAALLLAACAFGVWFVTALDRTWGHNPFGWTHALAYLAAALLAAVGVAGLFDRRMRLLSRALAALLGVAMALWVLMDAF